MRWGMKMVAVLTGAAVLLGSLVLCGAESYGEILETAVETEAEENPELPSAGSRISDFVPVNWRLMDSVVLDFNGDGIEDYVGVLEHERDDSEIQENIYPRILFAVASEGKGRYRLDFQDENLIRTEFEGGTFGDPYGPLTAEGTSFTTHSYGGSSWKWSEAYTYTYRDGIWYLMRSENIGSFGSYIYTESIDDYGTRTGMRRRRSSETEDILKWMEKGADDAAFDLVYQVALDPAPTLRQAGMRWHLSWDRVKEWPVESIKIEEGIEFGTDRVILPMAGWGSWGYLNGPYRDENCLLCTFKPRDDQKTYLALYRAAEREVSVVAAETNGIEAPVMYQGKIYYCTPVIKNISYRDNSGNILQSEEEVGEWLYRINPDGRDRREIFQYVIPEIGSGVLDQSPPYMALINELSGSGIVTEVYIEERPHLFYRMSLDGGEAELIGTVPAEPR